MSKKETSYLIIKEYINSKGVIIPTILVNTVSEIMEFDEEEGAIKMAQLFEANSDSGWKYRVRKIG